MSFGSLFDPDALEPFFQIPPVIFWLTILPIHRTFQIVEWQRAHVLPEVFLGMRLLPVLGLSMTGLPGFWSCHWDWLWLWWGQSRVEDFVPILESVRAVWFAPPFFIFSVPTPYALFAENVEPFASSVAAFVLVEFVR